MAVVEWHDRVDSVLYFFSRFPSFSLSGFPLAMNIIGYASRNEIKELMVVNRTDSDAGCDVAICADIGLARTPKRSSLLNVVLTYLSLAYPRPELIDRLHRRTIVRLFLLDPSVSAITTTSAAVSPVPKYSSLLVSLRHRFVEYLQPGASLQGLQTQIMGSGQGEMSGKTSITPPSKPQAASALSEKLKETRRDQLHRILNYQTF